MPLLQLRIVLIIACINMVVKASAARVARAVPVWKLICSCHNVSLLAAVNTQRGRVYCCAGAKLPIAVSAGNDFLKVTLIN
jgi:hypothetical protein